jgi:hypothetical protein
MSARDPNHEHAASSLAVQYSLSFATVTPSEQAVFHSGALRGVVNCVQTVEVAAEQSPRFNAPEYLFGERGISFLIVVEFRAACLPSMADQFGRFLPKPVASSNACAS